MRAGLADGFAEAGLGRDFERQRVRVDVVVAAVVQRGAEIHGRKCASTPSSFWIFRPFSTAGTNSRGTEPPVVSSTNSKPAPRSSGSNLIHTSANWPEPPVCFLCTYCSSILLVNVLAVGHLRLAHDAFDAELGAHAIERDFEVQLAHAAQDGLARLAIGFQMQRRIGANHLAERRAELLRFGLGLRLHRHADDRVREAHALQHHLVLRVAQRVAGVRFGQRDERDDVAGARFFDRVRFSANISTMRPIFSRLPRVVFITDMPLVSTPEYTRTKVSAP